MLPHVLGALLATFACFHQAGKDPRSSADLFPDKRLEAAIREKVLSKSGTEQPLTVEDVRNISQIFGKGKGIRDLRGLERCGALTTLDLSNNDISDLTPLADLKKLQGLYLEKNHVSDLKPLAGLTGLQSLEVSDNEIVDLKPLSGLTNLSSLSIANNKISDPSAIAGLLRLWSLSLSGNGITSLTGLKELKQLCVLSLKGNRIADLSPLSGLPALRMLFLENNQIRDLDVLVDMATKDAQNEKRFAPFVKIYLSGNPLSDAARTSQAAELRSTGASIFLGGTSKP